MTRIEFPPSFTDQSKLTSPPDLLSRYVAVRGQTDRLCEPLEPEDFVVQSMPDASPVKWHLAHTSWFFETFVLASADPSYQTIDPRYNFLFNSYYNAIGERIARDRRGILSRPTIGEVERYRRGVDERVGEWLATADDEALERLGPLVVLGLHHEQQHQELIVTDLKHAFASNPLRPIYLDRGPDPASSVQPLTWSEFGEGIQDIGFDGPGFSFDNESPRHRVYLQAHALADRPATNAEYQAFLEDDGYGRPEFWLSDGWATRKARNWSAPLYWEKVDGVWSTMTLAGLRPLVADEPVTHLSFYEADAFARWSGARLPTEAEWEVACSGHPVEGNFLEAGRYHPAPRAGEDAGIGQMFGDVWEWTQSPYTPYPGYRPASGALGEYNGKFMCNTMILRGGSCATPRSHIRATYRNFFGPDARWQFSGVRLARDLS